MFKDAFPLKIQHLTKNLTKIVDFFLNGIYEELTIINFSKKNAQNRRSRPPSILKNHEFLVKKVVDLFNILLEISRI